ALHTHELAMRVDPDLIRSPIAVLVKLNLNGTAWTKCDPRIYFSIEVDVRKLAELLSVVTVGAQHVLLSIKVGIHFTTQQDPPSFLTRAHVTVDPQNIRTRCPRRHGLDHVPILSTAELASRLLAGTLPIE